MCKNKFFHFMQGSTLIFVILLLLVASILSVGILDMTSKSSINQALRANHDQVMYLAQSGVNWSAAVYNASNGTAQDFGQKLVLNPYTPPLGSVTLGNFTRSNGTEIWVSVTASLEGNTYTLLKQVGTSLGSGGSEDAPPGAAKFVISSIGQNMQTINQGEMTGNIAGKNITLSNRVKIKGNIISSDDLRLVNQSEVVDDPNTEKLDGNVCVGGDLNMENQTFILGDATVHGNVIIGNHAEIGGNLRAGGNVELQNGAKIAGNVIAGGKVTLGSNNAFINGDVWAGGDITMGSNTQFMSSVKTAHNVSIGWSAQINGDVLAMGYISMLGGSNKIIGDAIAEGSINMGWKSEIVGTSSPYTTISPAINTPEAPSSCTSGLCAPRLFDLSQDSGNGQTYSQRIDSAPNIKINWNKNSAEPISPGYYKNMNLGGKNKIYLTIGNYYFNSINSGTKPKIYIDLSQRSSVPNYKGINIFVKKGVTWGDQLDFYVKSSDSESYVPIRKSNGELNIDSSLAGYVYIESGEKFEFNNQNEWLGTILAKGDGSRSIVFCNQQYLLGSYHTINGGAVNANQMDVYYVVPQYALAHPEQWECE